jgi:hypothetical protein
MSRAISEDLTGGQSGRRNSDYGGPLVWSNVGALDGACHPDYSMGYSDPKHALRVAQQDVRSTTGIGTDQLWAALRQWGAATLMEREGY